MKNTKFFLLGLFTAGGLFFTGWHLGQQSANKLPSDVVKMLMFDTAYSQIAHDEVILEQIDSGRIEDAKTMVCLNLSGNIFGLNNVVEETNSNISFITMKLLLKMDQDSKNHNGSARDTSNRILARVAKYRAEHPWKSTKKTPEPDDAEIEAKLTAILKQASESQK